MLRTVVATRYVTPLREGGSLPAIVEADDLGTYVLKFRGAGQGRKALVAELVAGEIGRHLGLPVPEIVLVRLDPELGRSEPDPEIQDLIKASAGLNLALDYLPGSLGFDPLVEPPGSELASRIVWFDALVTNVDRTPRNTNLLVWHGKLWLIDHGASLYFHHNWPARDPGRDGTALEVASRRPFAAARKHVLLPFAGSIREADADLAGRLTPDALRSIVDLIPGEWLAGEPGFGSADEVRAAYLAYLSNRLREPRAWVRPLEEARGEPV
ncbi:MAG: aminotransferase class I and II [Actinomycetota bacterium]|nr:aminotransferase class I and II [Actinomycetota bacterium]